MARKNEQAEQEKRSREDAQFSARRMQMDLDLLRLRIHQAKQRHKDLAELLDPALELTKQIEDRLAKI